MTQERTQQPPMQSSDESTPNFPRHDKINGQRYADPVTVEFIGVKIETGQKRS